jgi:DNA-binding GntR family transcriptional regulator
MKEVSSIVAAFDGTGGRQTRAESVYARVRADILSGRLRPGQRLKFPDLCADYDASVGVIREALTRLAGEGLVGTKAHQGFEVTPLSSDHLAELTDARLQLESLVVQRSLENGDLQWESALVAAHHVLQATSRVDASDASRLSDRWTRAHAQFHSALLSACPNQRLRSIAEALRSEAELYRQWSVTLVPSAARDIDAEHKALLTAALSRDTGAAVAALQDHIRHTTRLLMGTAVQADAARANADKGHNSKTEPGQTSARNV